MALKLEESCEELCKRRIQLERIALEILDMDAESVYTKCVDRCTKIKRFFKLLKNA